MLAGPSRKNIPYTRTAGFILAAIPAVGLSLALTPSHASADTVSETPASPAATSASSSASSSGTSSSSSAAPALATSQTSTTPKTITVSGAIGELYTAMDGADGKLGLATSSETPLTGDAVWQQFQHGRIYWSQATGAHAIKGGIGDTYVALGDAALTKLGLPTYDQVKLPDGWYQQFQNAGIYWTNDGGKVVTSDVAAKYAALGKTTSATATASSAPSATASTSTATTATSANSAADATTKTSSNSSAANTASAKSTAQPTTAATSAPTPATPTPANSSSSSSASPATPSAAAPSTTQSPTAQAPTTQAPTSAIADAVAPSAQIATSGAIGDLYNQLGGANGVLGAATSSETALSGGGAWQQFANGRIYWSQATGAHAIKGGIGDVYFAMGGTALTDIGLPTGDERDLGNGMWVQQFQNGRIFWSPTTGAHIVHGGINDTYTSLGSSAFADLGLPTSDEAAVANGWAQQFEKGSIFWSYATAGVVVHGNIGAIYASLGTDGPASLGLPSGQVTTLADGSQYQQFQRGLIYWSQASGARIVHNGIGDTFAAMASAPSAMGMPTGDEVDLGNGAWMQQFQNGRIYWSGATGGHAIKGGIGDTFAAMGDSAYGLLGLPTGDETVLSNGWFQHFQNGSIFWSYPTAGILVKGGIGDTFAALGESALSTLGAPVSGELSLGNGAWMQQFQNGRIYWSGATGGHAIKGGIGDTFAAMGDSAYGLLGLPTGDETVLSNGWFQHFQNGSIFWSYPTAGILVKGGIGDTFAALGESALSTLGAPVSGELSLGNGAWMQQFQNGRIYWSGATGGHAIKGGIGDTFAAMGDSAYGLLGLPTGDEVSLPAGWYQQFQGGRIYWFGPTGGHMVRGGIGDSYVNQGASTGLLGLPTSSEISADGGSYQVFQGGRIYWKDGLGSGTVRGAMLDAYLSMNASSGLLAFPRGGEVAIAGGALQDFEGGRLYWHPNSYAYLVRGAIGATYDAWGGSSGALGFATSNENPTADGTIQSFQNGTIAWKNSGGTVVNVVNTGGSKPAAGDEAGYIRWVAGFAQEEQRRYRVPAAVSIAQSIIESGWGQSGLTAVDNNYFGIKCPAYGSPFVSGCTSYSTSEWVNGGYVTIQAGFRSYNSPGDSFLDHGFFLSLGDPSNSANRYYPAFLTTNDRDFVRAIAAAGYATDPTYANKIISIMDRYNLYQYDV
ncbi:glucosaminidase domain-containing protein [Propionibacterium freudenreichii]|uniref:glucosaminidase domain-containing protein n=1 Tax=Propionibacterium freudenreichii TaxID=1744 RepID=UPI002551C234|nr:glucosaminidase domain-containing protein [Propionibacterium freudenreichii]MDK9360283.1 glucosaminidase domain-containing protein [Propionibacterium freudenreichii]